MKVLKAAGALLAVLFAAIQLVRPERSNPPVDPARSLAAHARVAPEVARILDRACRDCHTYETRWPWYSHVAPMMWTLAQHVRAGRKHLNLSDWAGYDTRKADYKLGEICDEVKKGRMPLGSYRRAHREASLTEGDVAAICAWTELERQRLEATTRRSP